MDRHPSASLAEKTGRRASIAREKVRFLLIGGVNLDGLFLFFRCLVEVEFGLAKFFGGFNDGLAGLRLGDFRFALFGGGFGLNGFLRCRFFCCRGFACRFGFVSEGHVHGNLGAFKKGVHYNPAGEFKKGHVSSRRVRILDMTTGTIYESGVECAKALSVTPTRIYACLKSGKCPRGHVLVRYREEETSEES